MLRFCCKSVDNDLSFNTTVQSSFAPLPIPLRLVTFDRVCRTPLPALTTRGQQVKVYSQLAYEVESAGAVLNTVSIAPPTTYVGATVIDPKPGYHDLPVATLDFASLYPSIMQVR